MDTKNSLPSTCHQTQLSSWRWCFKNNFLTSVINNPIGTVVVIAYIRQKWCQTSSMAPSFSTKQKTRRNKNVWHKPWTHVRVLIYRHFPSGDPIALTSSFMSQLFWKHWYAWSILSFFNALRNLKFLRSLLF